MKKTIKLLIITAAIFIAAGGIIYANIAFFANHARPVKSDTIIVLGCKAYGATPSLSLEYRLDKALELYNKGYGSTIIVSGGQGSSETMPESTVMKKWLVKHNVNAAAILEENLSTSTFENLKYSGRIMEEKNLKTAVIVSNDFHIYRSLFLAERLGINCSGAPAPSVSYTRTYYNSREIISVVKSFLVDR